MIDAVVQQVIMIALQAQKIMISQSSESQFQLSSIKNMITLLFQSEKLKILTTFNQI